jgi:hypothetical protein
MLYGNDLRQHTFGGQLAIGLVNAMRWLKCRSQVYTIRDAQLLGFRPVQVQPVAGCRYFVNVGKNHPRPSVGAYLSPKESWAPSFKQSLALLGFALTGVSTWVAYKVGYRNETVFLPLWLSPRRRNPFKSELDTEQFIGKL